MALRINIPPLTRALLVVLVGLSVVYQAASYRQNKSADSRNPRGVPWIALTPQLSIYYPWAYITSTFAEKNVLTLLVGAATLLYGGKYLERAWGSAEFGKFLLIVVLLSNVVASCLYVLLFAITRADAQAWVTLQGSIDLQAAFLVAFKQLVPEHTVTILKGVIKIRVKHFPAIFLTANTVSGVVFGTHTAAVLAWLGFLTSWTYLRFYKRQPDLSGTNTGGTTLRGDASETFAFAYFWPDLVHGPVAAVTDSVFNLLVAARICTPFSAEDIQTSNDHANARGEAGLPSLINQGSRRGGSGKREEAERRRALALKALDQRLQAATANRQQPGPSAPMPSTVGDANPALEAATGKKDDSTMV
ncbi:hypothetical protein MMC32_005342 [Xylographa parallela]|nr:hypothetical protein [Xylographa parallela]